MCSIESGDFRHPTGMLYRDQRTTRSFNILQKFDTLNRNKNRLRSANHKNCDNELNLLNLNLSEQPFSHELVSQCTCCNVNDDRNQVKEFDNNATDSKNQNLCYLKDSADRRRIGNSDDVSDKNKKNENSRKHTVNFTNCDRYLYIKKRSQMDYKMNNQNKFSLSKLFDN